ncbi:hypothetical protein ACLUEY_13420 [Vreelandella aquamarina]
MADVIIFKPKSNLEAAVQLGSFITMAKGLKGFDKPNASLKWDNYNWSYWLKGVNFAKLGQNVRNKEFDPKTDLLDASIVDFAKAYVLYQQSLRKTAAALEVVAVRYLEAALMHTNGHADVTVTVSRDFDRAAQLCQERDTPARAYRVGSALEKLATFLSDKKLTERHTSWSNTIPRPNDARGHRKNKEAAAKKMPFPTALDAIAEIWANNPESHRDIFVTSNCVILLSQPSRVGELNLIPHDCLPSRLQSDLMPGEGGEESPLFIKWYGQKGFGHISKPIPSVLAPFCVEAVKRIRSITEEPRRLAKFLEENPNDFPVHDRCPKVSQDTILTPQQVLDALCLSVRRTARTSLKTWLKSILKFCNGKEGYSEARAIISEALNGLYDGKAGPGKEDHYTMTLRKLNVLIRSRYLPKHFPYVDEKETIKFQDALNCYFVGQLGSQEEKGHGHLKPYMIRSISSSTLNDSLTTNSGEHGSKRYETMNIFRQWGYIGDEYRLTTHQFRHFLNTIAARGSVGQTELARWSGRLNVSQNRVYNHRGDEELTGELKSIGLGEQKSSLVAVVSSNEPVMVSDVAGMVGEDRVAHRTLIGVCIHDFAMEPCQKDRDCLACKEHICIKGEDERLRRIKKLRDGLKESLAEAQRGADEGYFGADKWVVDRMDRLKRSNELIAILEDPEIKDGAVISCTDNGYLPVKKALEANGKLKAEERVSIGSERGRDELAFTELRDLLGH